jgi:hypothetical protein
MPITTDESNINIKYIDKSMFGCSLSCSFIAIILFLISLYAPEVGILEKMIE